MARAPQNYAHNTQLSTTPVDIVQTVPTATKSDPRKLSFFNSGSVSRTVTVYVVETSGTADTGNTLAIKAIPPGKTWNVIEIQGEVLSEGMKLQADQDAGTDVNANCSGTDVT